MNSIKMLLLRRFVNILTTFSLISMPIVCYSHLIERPEQQTLDPFKVYTHRFGSDIQDDSMATGTKDDLKRHSPDRAHHSYR